MEGTARIDGALLSERGRDRMLKLQRQLHVSCRSMDQAFSRLVAAVSACDRPTQEQFLSEYVVEVINHRDALRQLVAFINSRVCAAIDSQIDVPHYEPPSSLEQ